MKKNILCITHADFETPGVIETWAKNRGYGFTIQKPYCGDRLSDADAFDMLIVMGGPQSSLQLSTIPYLQEEVSLIRQAIAQHKPILGFCLGAQLIGEALGASAARSPEKEVGVYPIDLTPDVTSDPLFHDFPPAFPVIHWHNDMPGLTEDAVILATSKGCPRQIVRYKRNVYGFQCHMEIDLEGITTMVEAVPEDLAPSTYTQDKQTLLSQDYASINECMVTILGRFASL